MAASPGSQAHRTERPLQSASPPKQPRAASPSPRRRRRTSKASSPPAASTATSAQGIQSTVCDPPSSPARTRLAIAGRASHANRARSAARGRGSAIAAGRLIELTLGALAAIAPCLLSPPRLHRLDVLGTTRRLASAVCGLAAIAPSGRRGNDPAPSKCGARAAAPRRPQDAQPAHSAHSRAW